MNQKSTDPIKPSPEAASGEQQPKHLRGKRFPRAAVDYIDALLEIQRIRFEEETAFVANAASPATLPARPKRLYLAADADDFVGTGWSALGTRRDGTLFRWMGRIGTLLIPADLSNGGKLMIMGCGFTRKKLLGGLHVWLDDVPIETDLARKGFNRWILTGTVPAIAPRPYHILRLESDGLARLAVGLDSFFSVAVSSVEVKA